jgi:type I restriction enzyme S subunit
MRSSLIEKELDTRITPAGWMTLRLEDVAFWGSGGTPSRSQPAYFKGSIPWIKTGELISKYITETEEKITAEAIAKSSAKLFPPGAVAIAMYGATIGKTSILARDAATNQACAVAIPDKDLICSDYLYYYFRYAINEFIKLGKGGAQPNISQTILKQFPIPVAPLAEQERIVAKIEQLFSAIDDNKTIFDQLEKQLGAFKHLSLSRAFNGQLTSEWRIKHSVREDAQVLLKHALKSKKLKAVPLTQEATEKLPELPKGWRWASASQVCDVKSGIALGKKRKSDEKLVERPYLRVANVQRGYLDLTEIKTVPLSEEEACALYLQRGDVLMNEGGDRDKLGRGWVWDGSIEKCVHQNHVFRLRPYGPDVLGKYISIYANAFGQSYFMEEGKQTTNLASISLSKIQAFPIPIPPADEITQIVERIEDNLLLLKKLDDDIQSVKSMTESLKRAILNFAFSGKLVEQNCLDEAVQIVFDRKQK